MQHSCSSVWNVPSLATRASPASAPMATAMTSDAEGKSMEAGSVAVLASMQHPFSATQDWVKTKSVRGLGDGHSSFERYTGSGGAVFAKQPNRHHRLNVSVSRGARKKSRLYLPSSCESPVNSFEARRLKLNLRCGQFDLVTVCVYK